MDRIHDRQEDEGRRAPIAQNTCSCVSFVADEPPSIPNSCLSIFACATEEDLRLPTGSKVGVGNPSSGDSYRCGPIERVWLTCSSQTGRPIEFTCAICIICISCPRVLSFFSLFDVTCTTHHHRLCAGNQCILYLCTERERERERGRETETHHP